MVMNPASPWPAPVDPKLEIAKQMRESAQLLLDEAAKFERQAKEDAKAKLPPVPYANFWRVDVQFTSYGSKYTYLLYKHGSQWFTTGTTAETAKFDSWQALWAWLEGPDVYAHSRLQKLVHVDGGEEIEWGAKPVLGIMKSAPNGNRW